RKELVLLVDNATEPSTTRRPGDAYGGLSIVRAMARLFEWTEIACGPSGDRFIAQWSLPASGSGVRGDADRRGQAMQPGCKKRPVLERRSTSRVDLTGRPGVARGPGAAPVRHRPAAVLIHCRVVIDRRVVIVACTVAGFAAGWFVRAYVERSLAPTEVA